MRLPVGEQRHGAFVPNVIRIVMDEKVQGRHGGGRLEKDKEEERKTGHAPGGVFPPITARRRLHGFISIQFPLQSNRFSRQTFCTPPGFHKIGHHGGSAL